MSTLNVTDARAKLYALIEETVETHKPITITGKRGNAVLLSEATGMPLMRLYISSLSQVCESQFERAWKPTSTSAVKIWASNVEDLLHQASSKRCSGIGLVRS